MFGWLFSPSWVDSLHCHHQVRTKHCVLELPQPLGHDLHSIGSTTHMIGDDKGKTRKLYQLGKWEYYHYYTAHDCVKRIALALLDQYALV
jgi:hypothetical protein